MQSLGIGDVRVITSSSLTILFQAVGVVKVVRGSEFTRSKAVEERQLVAVISGFQRRSLHSGYDRIQAGVLLSVYLVELLGDPSSFFPQWFGHPSYLR